MWQLFLKDTDERCLFSKIFWPKGREMVPLLQNELNLFYMALLMWCFICPCRKNRLSVCTYFWLLRILLPAFPRIWKLGEGYSFSLPLSSWKCQLQDLWPRWSPLGTIKCKYSSFHLQKMDPNNTVINETVSLPRTTRRLYFIARRNFIKRTKMAFLYFSTFRKYTPVLLYTSNVAFLICKCNTNDWFWSLRQSYALVPYLPSPEETIFQLSAICLT